MIQKPKYCCWVLTYKCMFECQMCRIWNINFDDHNETLLADKKKFVTGLADFVDENFEFHLSGGEPLLSDDLIPLLRHINKHRFRTNLVTNGWLVDDYMLQQLQDAGLSSLTFSLDGMNAATHDFLRGVKGSFQRIMSAIEMAERIKSDLDLSIITLINGYNLDEVLALTDWVEHHPILKMISFQVVTQPFSDDRNDRWFEEEQNKFLWPQDLEKTAKIFEQLKSLRENGAKIGNNANQFDAFKNYFKDPNKFLKKVRCSMGDYEFHIDPFGKMFFCNNTEPIGNITKDNLPDVWKDDKTQKTRDKVYKCKDNCHIMVNCFYEDENYKGGFLNRLLRFMGK